MTVKTVHDFLESNCPNGGGFAIGGNDLAGVIEGIIISLASSTGRNTNIPLDQSSSVRFSFLFDSASFQLSTTLGLSVKLKIKLHPNGKPNEPIVTVDYDIQDAQLEPLYDTAVAEFCWISASTGSISLADETWGTDQALIDAGYQKSDHTADKEKFLEDIYYGFKWLNSRALLPSIIRNIPFPQVQKWFLPFALMSPFKYAVQSRDLIIWTDVVRNVFQGCGTSETPSTPPSPSWRVRPGSPAPSSRFDNADVPFALYIAATNLVSWQAGQVAPAVMLSGGGGGFIRWSYDVAAAVRSLMLDLIPAPNGGGLSLHLALRIAGLATAWIDGPSGTRLSLATAGLTADGTVDATAIVEYDPKSGHIDLETTVAAAIDKNSVDLSGGGLFDEVLADIVEFLFKRGTFNIDTSYYSRTKMPLIDLNDLALPHIEAFQRVGNRSMLTFYARKEEKAEGG
jgi:hypothetical protein